MSLHKYAKVYLKNQKTYAHLNAFISRVDPTTLTECAEHPESPNDFVRAIAVKDNICTKELPTTAASGILEGFTSPYDATVVKLLRDDGAVVVGKTNLDEFGMGSHSINSHAGPVKLQRYKGEEASAGGSSGGSAVAVATSQCWAALGTDTGGSVRLPAAYTGTVGFKPSYGRISRWGVLAYANSLDTVGIFAKNIPDVRYIYRKLNVHDPEDPTSITPSTRSRLGRPEVGSKSLRIGIPLDYNIATLHPTVRNAWIRALRALSERGHTLHSVRLPATQHALSAYYVLAPAEASSNLAKYDGVRFGRRADGIDGTPESVLFAKTRGQGLGQEVQRRILLGGFSLSAQAIDNYFIQAQKVRRLVQQDFNRVFARKNPLVEGEIKSTEEKVDVLLCPTAPTLAPPLSELKDQDPLDAYMNDVFTVPASLAGLPAISVPIPITDQERIAHHGANNIEDSAGLQIIGQYGDDRIVLRAADALTTAFQTPQKGAAPDMTAWGATFLGPATRNDRRKYAESAIQRGITIAETIERRLEAKETKEPRQPGSNPIADILNFNFESEELKKAAMSVGLTWKEYVERIADEKHATDDERKLFEYLTIKAKQSRLNMQRFVRQERRPSDPNSAKSRRESRRGRVLALAKEQWKTHGPRLLTDGTEKPLFRVTGMKEEQYERVLKEAGKNLAWKGKLRQSDERVEDNS